MDINDHEGTTGGSLQASQLATHQAHNLVQLCRALLPILGQALVTLCGDGLTHLFGPIHLQTAVKIVRLGVLCCWQRSPVTALLAHPAVIEEAQGTLQHCALKSSMTDLRAIEDQLAWPFQNPFAALGHGIGSQGLARQLVQGAPDDPLHLTHPQLHCPRQARYYRELQPNLGKAIFLVSSKPPKCSKQVRVHQALYLNDGWSLLDSSHDVAPSGVHLTEGASLLGNLLHDLLRAEDGLQDGIEPGQPRNPGGNLSSKGFGKRRCAHGPALDDVVIQQRLGLI
ncbi:MAG: hypothetical protein FRX49_04190 [Trebouxia sp. A1-2]|nr:MAG: hypothetical protein FRX49_04190 [Trebouxia sp. A1-2]